MANIDDIQREASTRGPWGAVFALHREFLAAIEEEIAATYQADLRQAIRLPDGQLMAANEFEAYYDFELDAAPEPWMRHSPVRLRLGSEAPRSVAIRLVPPRRVVLRFRESHGERIAPGALMWPDTTWMLEGLLGRLIVIDRAAMADAQPDPPFDLEMAFGALGLANPLTSRLCASEVDDAILRRLNFDQRDALLHALASRAHHLWGPPGTGKTLTVAAVAEAHYRLDRSVLIASPTHAASDLVLQQLCNQLEDEPGYGDGRIIRLGSRSSKHLDARHADAVRYDRVLARQSSALVREIERLKLQDADLAKAAAEASGNPDHEKRIRLELTDTRHQIYAARTRLENLPRLLLAEAQVVSGTCHGIILTSKMRRSFDALVLDEAPMAMLPWVYAVAGLARSHVLVAGDHMQLPAPVTTQNPRAVAALATDPFRLSGYAEALDRGLIPSGLTVLRTQYRMPDSILRIVGPVFYRDLISSSVAGRQGSGEAPVVVIDTSGLRPRVRGHHGSRENILHAQVVVSVASAIAAKRMRSGRPTPECGIYVPYRAQRALVGARARHLTPEASIRVSTVHASQGSQAEIVIVDMTDTGGLPPGPFTRGESKHSVGARLLNVAISRTREHLIVVADVGFVLSHGGAAIRAVLEKLLEVGRLVDARDVLRRGHAAVPPGDLEVIE